PGLLHDLVGPAADAPPGPPPASHPGVRGQSTPASAEPPAYPPGTGGRTADRHPAHPSVPTPPPVPTEPWGSWPTPGPLTGTRLPRPDGPADVTPTVGPSGVVPTDGSADHRTRPTSAPGPDPATAHLPSAHRAYPPSTHRPDRSGTHRPDPAAAVRPDAGAPPGPVAARPGPEWTIGAGLGWLLRPGRRRTSPRRPPTTGTGPEPTTETGFEPATETGAEPVTGINPRSGTRRDPEAAVVPGARTPGPRGWVGHRPSSDVGRAPGTPPPAGTRHQASDVPPQSPGRSGLVPPGWPDRDDPGRPVRSTGLEHRTAAGTGAGRRPTDGRPTSALFGPASVTGTGAATGDRAGGDGTGGAGGQVTGGGRHGGTRPGPGGGAPARGNLARRIGTIRWPEDDPAPAGDPWPTLPDTGPTGTGAAGPHGSGPVGADPWPALPADGAWWRPTGTARDDARYARLDAEQRGS
ncbi:hypothetical protein B5D80_32135, partial [Micromonospora wenchangensis]